MNKIKEFFITVWCCITFPFNWLISRKFEKKFTERVERDKRDMITEKDVEFLKSLDATEMLTRNMQPHRCELDEKPADFRGEFTET